MENSSISKRLIDFGTDDNEYDEVLEPDLQQQQPQQNQQHQSNSQQLLQHQQGDNNNQHQNKNQSHQQRQQSAPPQLPPPKQNKSVKTSTKNSAKTKIPRSPSCASRLSYNNSVTQYRQDRTLESSIPPPQTPPLPLNYQKKNKYMNGGGTTQTSAVESDRATTPPVIVSPQAGNNYTNNANNVQISSGLMGGGVMGANGNHSQHRGSVGGGSVAGAGSGVNISGSRRPQIQISPIAESSPKHYQYLTLTVRKDENGYGMKVSGDNPVYVESVKPGGAAQIAGLIAGDMILKVNGQEVRSEKHPTVVSLIKASTIVELAVKRTPKMARPTSVGVVPSTPILSGRDRTASITGPQPVDSIKRREMETFKIQTLQKMLEQEKLNLERLKGDTNNPSYKLSEANMRKLREQLRQVGAEALGQTPPCLNHFNKHRRVVSSPENMHPRNPDRHTKTTSGTWDLIEREGEITPPGTPPPPYPSSSSHMHSHSTISGMSTSQHTLQGSFSEEGPPGPGEVSIFMDSHHFIPLGGIGVGACGGGTSGAISPIQMSAVANVSQKEILSMEDEDASDQEGIDENGPFNYLQRLLEQENVAFLAVFLNYVLSNSEPAPLLFYLITGLYREGTAKDMRKWAYEIHSTFLVPRAPLSWYRQDESLAREVDSVLQNEFDKVEILRKVFWKSRKRARDIICEQLRELQAKRTAGLGTIFGPTDAQLAEAKGDKQKEQHIFEETLLRKLQFLIEEYEKDLPSEDPKKLALCSALSTVIHRIFITRSNPNSIIDRVHHFVSREKSFKSRLMGKNRKMIVRGHPLVLRQYYEVTHCNHCQTIIWGVSPQGYHCTDCKLNIHRSCSKVLDENCPGPLPQAKRKEPHNDNKISKFMGKIRPRTSSDFIAMEKRARHEDDVDLSDISNERLHSTSIVRQPSDRRPDAANVSIRSNGNSSQHNSSDLQNSQASDASAAADAASSGAGGASSAVCGADSNAQDAADTSRDSRKDRLQNQHQQNKSAPVSVNRSESYKERLSHKRSRNSRRKTSDPSLASRPNDDQPDVGLSNSNYTASSNSSLSSGGGSESPSNSMDQVTAGVTAGPGQQQQQHGTHHHHHQHSNQDSFHSSTSGGASSGPNANNSSFWGGSMGSAGGPTRQWQFESDEDDDLQNEADWSSNVAAEMLAALTDAEKKRQEIINEIYQTERNHVRTLKLLERLFFCPLQESGVLSVDHLLLLFPPALLSLRELHSAFEQRLKQRRLEHNHVVLQVGDLLAGMFDGQSGEELCEYAAQFCARQQIALEALKEKRRKDESLQKILTKAESHKACRRLQLKDLLPTVLQRLTKYPLLFENLHKVTTRVAPDDVGEAEAIKRAMESSKKILVDVNQAVKHAEDAHKLQNIQRKLDKSTFDKDEFKNLDLTQHRLIHDGCLTMKKNPGIQLHGLLFENMIVLLTKQDDKYSLKYLNATRISEVNNKPLSPIMNIDSETLVRQEAADKNSFFLIKTKTSQMLELRAPSSSECKTWFKHISDAAEQYKPRSKNTPHESVDDPAIATLPHSNTKESVDITQEQPPPASATATMITTPLAPMMMLPNSNHYHPHPHHHHCIDLRNGREGTSFSEASVSVGGSFPSSVSVKNNRMGSIDLSSSVNRTMSTRSCGDNSNNYVNTCERAHQLALAAANGVTLRHTQSARQAAAATETGDDESSGSKRDSTSIIYSNNSNNTRTLMQSSALVEPTAIQISISPAHTAEPVLTPAEKLRRLDVAIRDGLLEKQKIICDMFRLPIEHFNEIIDIASLPEAPKDSSDIALATYAQVQSLTEVVNEYMKVTPEQEISAVSMSVCDQCHEKQRKQQLHANGNIFRTPPTPSVHSAASNVSSAASPAAQRFRSPSPPPLPPPNKQQAQAQHKTTTPAKRQTHSLDEQIIHEDDDGYCEIDELRLPALPSMMSASVMSAMLSKPAATAPPPLPPPAGKFKSSPPPPPPPPPSAAVVEKVAATTGSALTTTEQLVQSNSPQLTKRQSTLSAESIPEESAEEVTKALGDNVPAAAINEEPSNEMADDDEMTAETGTEERGAASLEVASTEDAKKEKNNIENPLVEQEEKVLKVEPEDKKDDDGAIKLELKSLKPVEEHNNDEQRKELDVEAAVNTVTSAISSAENASEADGEVAEVSAYEPVEKDTENAKEAVVLVPAELQQQSSMATEVEQPLANREQIAINEASDTLATLKIMVDSMCQTTLTGSGTGGQTTASYCGPNRIMHATSLEPSVPCYALNSIVTALNTQISLLLPKINERDMERDRLRKENQHLRELLNAMHEHQRVQAKMETPKDITTSADANDEIDAPSSTCSTSNTNSKASSCNAAVKEVANTDNTEVADKG